MKWAAAGLAVFIAGIILLADRGGLGPLDRVYDFPYGDKAGHFLLFGLLNGVAILAAATGAEEYSQRFFAGRTSSIFDWLATAAGMALFGYVAVRLEQKRRARGESQIGR